jgi:IS30 family transposase
MFWRLIAQGLSTVEAGRGVGICGPQAGQWFSDAGGMSAVSLEESSCSRYLSLTEREEIAVQLAAGKSVRAIARLLGRAPSTISRELRRNTRRALIGHYWTNRSALPGGRPPRRPPDYRAVPAQHRAERMARRPKVAKLAADDRLRGYVQDKLIRRECWSPEQIAARIRIDYPDDERMRVSHETIYQSLYVQGRGALRRELTICLRTGRALRRPRRRVDARRKRQIPPELMISQRPAQIEDRAVPGHWEGDLILGPAARSAIGTLVERSTRYVMLLHLPTSHNAEAVRDAIAETIVTLPEHLRRSLTWDQGTELAQHAQLKVDTNLDIYFCDPHSPWQRGTNENTNGLLRQYFPKGTNLAVHTPDTLNQVAAGLNGRPRKTLGWRTPAEALNDLLSTPPPSPPVATTG